MAKAKPLYYDFLNEKQKRFNVVHEDLTINV